MGGFACCLLVVFLCSLLISGCGGMTTEEQLKEHGGTCLGHRSWSEGTKNNKVTYRYQNPDCVCPTNNTCTWAFDEVCDEMTPELQQFYPNVTGNCPQGTDCEDCGTCNWYRCVSKAEVPKPTTLDKCENWTQVQLPTPSPTWVPTQPRETCCLNTCPFANDAVCQDGGTGSVTDPFRICESGTDCDDCGDRCR